VISIFALEQNYPNPFNPGTVIEYTLPAETHVTIDIYNGLGQKVRSLVHEKAASGRYTIKWNAMNDNGQLLPPGVYLARLKNGANETRIIKMVLTK